MKRQGYLQMAEDIICNNRESVHGKPENSFGLMAEYWSTYLSQECNVSIALCASDVAVMMTLFKIARLQMNANHNDNVVDGIGYLAIAGELISSTQGSEELLNQK